jgi:general secretion pathway protein D
VNSLAEYVDMLDKPVDSVILETEVVELNEQAARNIGLSFGAGQPIATGTFQGRNNQTPQTSLTVQAAIYAEVSRGNGRILARPRIVAQNNASASIVTGEQIPIITSITYPGATTVVQQQVQYVNVGISLQVQPRIAADGNVTAKVISQVSSVSGYVQGYPQISQRQASTTASVADGTAVIIGGLVQDAELRSLSRVPGISDWPIIGPLFRHTTTSSTHIDLYILITPHVVRSSAPPGSQPR